MTDPIHFYSTADEHGELSNFAAFPIRLRGKTWPTSENYFQAMKFAGLADEDEVRKARSPTLAAASRPRVLGPGRSGPAAPASSWPCEIAARLGRSRARPLRRDWEKVKDRVMHEALTAKFTQHEELRALLLSTGDAVLVEHTENDSYWGDGGDGSGKNMLGRLLMRVRDELRAE